jgi:tetratricopeptide (TPR) repeat protein
MLPNDKWGTIVTNYKELYSNIGDYTSQLRALEKASAERPNDPALRFLLGWHYGYLGFPTEAVRELNKTLELVPGDQVAKTLRDDMAGKLSNGELPAPEPVETPEPTEEK